MAFDDFTSCERHQKSRKAIKNHFASFLMEAVRSSTYRDSRRNYGRIALVTNDIYHIVSNTIAMQHERIALFLLRLGLLFSARKPQQREQEESYAGTDRASIVGPGCAQEPWVSVMSWWHNRNRGRTLESRASMRFTIVRADVNQR